MLEKIRRPGKSNTKGQIRKWIAYGVFGLICLVFVFFTPLTSQLTGYGEGVVAVIGRESIRSRELSRWEQNLRRRDKDRFNTAGAEEARRLEKQLKQTALSHLINVYLISQGAERAGFFVGDRELREFIRSLPVFQEDGRFVYSHYRAFLEQRQIPPGQFEKEIRRELMRKGWTEMFFKAVKPNELEKAKNSSGNLYEVRAGFAEIEGKGNLIKELETLLGQNSGKKAVLKLLKQNKITLRDTGPFSLSSRDIPFLRNSKKAQQALFDFLPQTGLIPKVIKTRGKAYLLEVKSFKKKTPKRTQEESLLLSFDKPSRLFESWVKFQEKTIKIHINEKPEDSRNF